ncbi:hypothetical protein DRF68_12650 [Candidatus Chryseobacterium massiliae]|uniref:Baseplate structural protein Gp10 C-terminal domain-containing protein n=2 Tax=Candidatus Chryseobacterium massiliense TaxID=204089 RepID=A0A3D9B2N8_9FLAO|nr:hypothetical protein DRF68_12650 [Candidatus Chryseobacterium massiliae]
MRININFNQTGGVPMTNDLMSVIMEAIATYNVLADVAGDLTILSGCVQSGSTISPGYVVVNGDVLYFEGGTLNSTVFVETTENIETFQDQIDRVLWTKKTLKFGLSTPPNLYNWSDFVRLDSLKVMKNKLDQAATQSQIATINSRLELLELKTAPIINGGIVVAWRKPVDEIPAGWKECLDFRGKTIVGWNPNESEFANLNSNVGSKTHTLTISEMPSHNHQIFGQDNNANPIGATSNEVANVENAGSFNRYSSSVGGGQPHNNIQPSRIALFIEPNFQ